MNETANGALNIVWTAAFVAVLVFAAATGLLGVDFGEHWDERIQLWLVNRTLATGVPIPDGFYNYPAMTYLISLASVAGDAASAVASFGSDPGAPKPEIGADVFYVRARVLFVLVSCLGGLWLFLALRALRGTLAGLIGGAAYLLSWEFAYHARWIAPDVVMAQFCALFLLALAMAERSPKRQGWFTFAAVAAGLATSTKYPAGMLLFALMLSWVLEQGKRPQGLAKGLKRLGALFAWFAAAYLVITPGTLLQPVAFFLDVQTEITHYQVGHDQFHGVGPYDIHGFFSYLGRLLEYLSLVLLSRNAGISLLLIALAGAGLGALWRNERDIAIILGFILAFTVFYFAAHVVFIVRNFLILLPVLAFLVGAGADHLLRGSLPKPVRGTIGALLMAAFGLGAYWLYEDARTIAASDDGAPPREAAQYMRAKPKVSFQLSEGVRAALARANIPPPANANGKGGEAEYLLFYQAELRASEAPLLAWPGTRRDTFEWFGTNEVNFNYYPTWKGRDRIVLVTMVQARRFGLPFFNAYRPR